jgi:hypothetical protein
MLLLFLFSIVVVVISLPCDSHNRIWMQLLLWICNMRIVGISKYTYKSIVDVCPINYAFLSCENRSRGGVSLHNTNRDADIIPLSSSSSAGLPSCVPYFFLFRFVFSFFRSQLLHDSCLLIMIMQSFCYNEPRNWQSLLFNKFLLIHCRLYISFLYGTNNFTLLYYGV